MTTDNWLVTPSSISTSQEALTSELRQLKSDRIAAGDYTSQDEEGISKANALLTDSKLTVSDELLERMRVMCRLWDVELRPSQITSHRPVIGRFIVAVKKLIYPILRFFLKDFIRQQRDFNAATVRCLAELSSDTKN